MRDSSSEDYPINAALNHLRFYPRTLLSYKMRVAGTDASLGQLLPLIGIASQIHSHFRMRFAQLLACLDSDLLEQACPVVKKADQLLGRSETQ
jgi:hypothetical protein